MTAPRIRIEGDILGHNTRVFYRQDDGEEVEISRCVTGLTVTVKVGEPTRASIDTILVGGTFNADLEKLALNAIGPSRWGGFWFRLRRRWYRIKYPVRAKASA